MKEERPAAGRRKPMLARILELEGALDGVRLERALAAWNQHRLEGRARAFGQVVLDLRLLDIPTLRQFIALQRRLAAAPGGRKPLGIIAVETGAVRPSVVAELLERQADTGRRLGELLVVEGVLRRPQVNVLLHLQRQTAPTAA
ncbi:MAG: hypothetical protein VKS61_06615 [Candidatus Sericytochromatia bacterium]|nr:hypothetical protein [Candidatus Sericytochromatia bacterium]